MRQLPGLDLPGDLQIVGTNGRALRGEMRSDLPGLPSVLLVELQHRKLECGRAIYVVLDPLALERAVIDEH